MFYKGEIVCVCVCVRARARLTVWRHTPRSINKEGNKERSRWDPDDVMHFR
jgi:hypothetical protein